ncbi:MAG TPA: hydroxyisourate hydrolase, partial [Roseiflexaceae bacterium]|nr:hydroxyisourate hydrolase [Roseiflexaceae bacterium]
MSGRLTTHVLDTMHGRPAAGMAVALWRIHAHDRILIASAITNSDGRLATPLLQGGEFASGVYELVFAVGAYFADQAVSLATPPFLDMVPIRFGIAAADAHYHVPLLVSPWAYST